jgi:SAM-dependent methyltransferase
MTEELRRIYSARYAGAEDYRNAVWQALTSGFFSKWIQPGDSVLDLGCGYGEFINNIEARERFAIDLNPAAREHTAPSVQLFEQNCSEPWPL